jgi:hypothetical protein
VGSVGSGGAVGVGGETPIVALPLTDTVLSPRPGALEGAGVVVGAGPVGAVVVAVEEPVTVVVLTTWEGLFGVQVAMP